MFFNQHFAAMICQATGAVDFQVQECIQELWSGYGHIWRVQLEGARMRSVVVKHVQLYRDSRHPRGWNSDYSHQRKLRSYEVETAWYRSRAGSCDAACRVPACLAIESSDNEVFMVLEDLDAAGFSDRRSGIDQTEMLLCLSWLAHFHARFLGESPTGLWQNGTYWHLDTRPDELAALEDLPLRRAAAAIDARLSAAHWQTLVHGDAKIANFCFGRDSVAAVDFQYVGGGCGMKDLAYFISSCLSEQECERQEQYILDRYFGYLEQALQRYRKPASRTDVEAEWRPLYRVAWADFHRFVKGWSPGHWKINSYSERITRLVLAGDFPDA
ncbi:phosphotransferase [Spirochaeta africana]|uniref:CHK kinase-like domain-containing protein n=1 Tax=Spirochaeta africana (strain ATCC 700263 / DSM 8902 / Z-7692) TaxID=889378 RepID=H9UHR2_SPIAZ|nr:phosphotransferase [Spirochaeta africana]AFG37055.1 protein of unknown function (DUF227) [Spirochaeta africana DSM 8902]